MKQNTQPFGRLIIAAVLLATSLADAHAQADEAGLANYRLSMASLKKLEVAAENLAVATRADRALMTDEDRDDAESIADIAELYRSRPALRQAIEKSGMSVDEFALCLMSWIQAGMTAAMVQHVPEKERVAAIARSGTPVENVHFYLANSAAMQVLGQKLQQLSN